MSELTPLTPYELEQLSIKYRKSQLKIRLALLNEEYKQILIRRQKEYGDNQNNG